MFSRKTRTLLSLALGLAATAGATARADTIATTPTAVSLGYDSYGTVTNSGISGLVTFNGVTGGTYNSANPLGNNDSIPLGTFMVSQAGVTGVQTATTINDPYNIILYTDAAHDQGVNLVGAVTGTVGVGGANTSLAATINSVTPIGTTAMPVMLSVPVGLPVNLSVPNGTDATTSYIVTATPSSGLASPTPAPEPASIAVFAALVGGIGVWHRRRASR